MMIPEKVIVTHVTAKSKLIQRVRTKKRNPDSESLSDKRAGSAGLVKSFKEEETRNDATVLLANVTFCLSRSELPRKKE